ncbi:MAG: hypothetical protein SH820_01045 [Xanthomonadales bacterium]|nr:hypothetical protein [Xanthomonadales bacterium]
MNKRHFLYPILLLAYSAACFSAEVAAPVGMRANQNTYSPLLDIMQASRNVEVTDQQLEELRGLQMEAIWDSLAEYQGNYALGFKATQPGKKLVGRALTMRFYPPRPDLREALDALAAEGDWDRLFYGRAADEGKPGDVVVADVGGTNGDQLFGGLAGLAMKVAGIEGAIIEGGSRDLLELENESFAEFPVFTRFFDIDTSKWLGAEWNVPIRVGNVTVFPGDIVIADHSGVIFIPPQIVAGVLQRAQEKAALEDYQRELLQGRQHRFREIYPHLSPELQKARETGEKQS